MKIITIPIIILDYLVKKKCGWWLWKLSAVFIFVSFIYLENYLFFLYFCLVFSSCTGHIDTKVLFLLELLFLHLVTEKKPNEQINDKVFVKINIAGYKRLVKY